MTLLSRKTSALYMRCRRFSATSSSPADYCLNLVKQHDYENFLSTLLLPREVRRAAFSIRAFNIEVSLISDKVTENHIGLMRYKWWEDALGGIYSGNPASKHPVALELSKVIKEHNLLKRQFTRLILSRSHPIPKTGFETMNSMEAYAEESTSPVYYLILQAAGVKDLQADHVASHIGKAQGLVNLIRSIPYYVKRRQSVVPEELLMKYNIPQEVMMSAHSISSQGVKEVLFEIASTAKVHLNKMENGEEEISSFEDFEHTISSDYEICLSKQIQSETMENDLDEDEGEHAETKTPALDDLIKEYVRTMLIPPIPLWKEPSVSDEGRKSEDEDQEVHIETVQIEEKITESQIDKHREETGSSTYWEATSKEGPKGRKETRGVCLLHVQSYGSLFREPYKEMELRMTEQCVGCESVGELGRCVCCGGTSYVSPSCQLHEQHLKMRSLKEARVYRLSESGREITDLDYGGSLESIN